MYLQTPDDRGDTDLEDLIDDETESEEDDREAILCAECDHEITGPNHETSVDGGFEHEFANPAGIVYRIGCFEEASGVGALGEETAEFTWFDGYTWQVVVCRMCTTHLGWRYWSSDHEFYGLILDRLRNV